MAQFKPARFITAIIAASLILQPVQAVFAAPIEQGENPQEEAPIVDEHYSQPTNEIIIKYKSDAQVNGAEISPTSASQMQRLSDAAGLNLSYAYEISEGAQVMALPEKKPLEEVQAISDQISQLPEVEYAEPNAILYRTATTPNDTYYSNQWGLFAPSSPTYGINASSAWDVTTGSSVVVAVVDTGYTSHPDFSSRIVQGYDFISDTWTANDGGGRDNNPSDPGDWVSAGYCGDAEASSWHGTHTTGIIAASGNNSTGIAGVNWNAKILPIRVLGRCGGSTADIADGIRWAAGGSVSGVPANANPAKVINISLGGQGSCETTMQNAINYATSAGATVVVSSGNENDAVSKYTPANCTGVITVGSTARNGSRAYYSNYGSRVDISAPGGQMSSAGDPGGIYSTYNTGTTTPSSSSYAYEQGTSMAAPMVSGVASLLYSLNPSLTSTQVLQILKSTATTFPSFSCTTSTCGSGIVNANSAVRSLPATTYSTTTKIDFISPEPSDIGEDTYVYYTVTPSVNVGTVNGTVTVAATDGSGSCSNPASSGMCRLSFSSSGSKTLRATYSGSSLYQASTSANFTHGVRNASGAVYSLFVPVILKPSPVFSGKVTYNNSPVNGAVLQLLYSTDGGSNYSTYATTASGSDGSYNFYNTPPITTSNQTFAVGWGTNTKYTDLLNLFVCNDVSLSNQDYKCDINIRNMDLQSPANNAHVSPPTTFSWALRSTSTDSYAITFLDGNSGEVAGGKSGLGYISSKTFTFTNFNINTLYAWKINVATPDGVGLGFNYNNIYFNNMNGSAPNAAESLNSGVIQLSPDASEGSLENALKLRDWLSPIQ